MSLKTRTYTLIVTTVVLTALAVSPLLAQTLNAAVDKNQNPGVVARFLELSEAQRQQWRAIRAAAHVDIAPLAEELAAAEEELQQRLAGDAPDATAIGNQLLGIRSLREEIHAVARQAVADFELLLTGAQAERLAAVRRAAPLCGLIPAFRELHLL